MKIEEIKNICVIGTGVMGRQLAVLCALSGYATTCVGRSAARMEEVKQFMERYLAGRVTKGKLNEAQAAQAAARLKLSTDLAEAAQSADFVIEAVIEDLAVKQELFKTLDRLCPPHALLATNSSYIGSSKLAAVTARPEQVCNMHFFNPALVMKLVEWSRAPYAAATADLAMALARRLNKEPVLLHREIYGFLVNRIFRAIVQEAFFLLDTGVASVEAIDSAVVNALGHPMGPFRLIDLTGIDLAYRARMDYYRETMDPAEKPPPSIVEKYARGEWGRKSGKGFYDYET